MPWCDAALLSLCLRVYVVEFMTFDFGLLKTHRQILKRIAVRGIKSFVVNGLG